MIACTGPQVFAQKAKEGVITLALTAQKQASVSNSKSAANYGYWSQVPPYYKTKTSKLTQTDIIKAIGKVLHGNASYYSSKAQLILVQGELSGFFNITPEMRTETVDTMLGTFTPTDFDTTTDFNGALTVRLATGRHFEEVPEGYATWGAWPPGHHQPWGQIFIKDPGKYTSTIICDNVTYFFSITVQECYDCFYLSSFISDATFTYKSASQSGPPCCSVPESLLGKGKDVYYMTLSFDNTLNNPFLNPSSDAWLGAPGLPLEGITGLGEKVPADGITPDYFPYVDRIVASLGEASPNLIRFTLNGLVTYTWNLKFINTSDLYPDFVGTAKYAANGYGFLALYCSLLTGSATITEKLTPIASCCLDTPWYDMTLTDGGYVVDTADYTQGWYPAGWNKFQDGTTTDVFATPVNVPVDLSYHFGFDQTYQPAIQWWQENNYMPAAGTPTYGYGATNTHFVPVSGGLGTPTGGGSE